MPDGRPLPRFQIRSSHRRYWIDTGDGQPLDGKTYACPHIAECRAHWAEVAAYQAPEARRRPCLRCGTPFDSQGRHNRLCQNCRDTARNHSDGRCQTAV